MANFRTRSFRQDCRVDGRHPKVPLRNDGDASARAAGAAVGRSGLLLKHAPTSPGQSAGRSLRLVATQVRLANQLDAVVPSSCNERLSNVTQRGNVAMKEGQRDPCKAARKTARPAATASASAGVYALWKWWLPEPKLCRGREAAPRPPYQAAVTGGETGHRGA